MCASKRCEGLPVCRVKAVPSFLIHFKTLSIGLFPARTGLSRQEKEERKEKETSAVSDRMRFLSGVSLTTNNLATQPTEPVYAITTVGSEISSVQSQQGTHIPQKTKPVLKTSQFRQQMWSAATWKYTSRPAEVNLVPRALFPGFGAPWGGGCGRGLFLSHHFSFVVRELSWQGNRSGPSNWIRDL